MRFSEVFKNLIVKYADEKAPAREKGRPRVLEAANAAELIFKVTRTGMQWREVVPVSLDGSAAPFSYVTVFRRFKEWGERGVFSDAYKHALRLYKRLHPSTRYCTASTLFWKAPPPRSARPAPPLPFSQVRLYGEWNACHTLDPGFAIARVACNSPPRVLFDATRGRMRRAQTRRAVGCDA